MTSDPISLARAQFDVSDHVWKTLRPLFVARALKRGEHLVTAGQPFRSFALVLSGLLRRVAEFNYLEKCEREFELLTLSAEARYLALSATHGPWINHIPQYYLASYLGITPVALSRIRRRRARRGYRRQRST